jgi:hypothetical protein
MEGNLGQDAYWKGNYYILLECGRPFGSRLLVEIIMQGHLFNILGGNCYTFLSMEGHLGKDFLLEITVHFWSIKGHFYQSSS